VASVEGETVTVHLVGPATDTDAHNLRAYLETWLALEAAARRALGAEISDDQEVCLPAPGRGVRSERRRRRNDGNAEWQRDMERRSANRLG
jgi:hypothetical protein